MITSASQKRKVARRLISTMVAISLLSMIGCSCDKNPTEPTNNRPVVSIIGPPNNTRFNSLDTITLIGKVTDPEDGNITGGSLVWTSDKDGRIGAGFYHKIDSLTINTHNIVLSATDNEGLKGFDSVTILIEQNFAPIVSITYPADSTYFSVADTVFFACEVTDPEDGDITGSSIVWTSDKDGQLGTGNALSVSGLSVNRHIISVTATDSYGNSTTACVTISVSNTFARSFRLQRHDKGYCVLETDDGGYLVAGVANPSYDADPEIYVSLPTDMYIVKTDAYGSLVWQRGYGGPGNDVAYSACETPDGSCIIAGRTDSYGVGETGAYLIKVDINGNLAWERTFGDNSPDDSRCVINTSDNCVVLAGSSYSAYPTGYDPYLVKVDYNGNLIWERTFARSESWQGYSVIETADAGFLMAGTTRTGTFLLRTDTEGNLSWEKTIDGGSGFSVCQAADGGYLVAGASCGDLYLLKLDAVGNSIWERSIGGDRSDVGRQVKQTSDGNYIVIGHNSSYGAGNYDVWLIKIDDAGSVIWERTFEHHSTSYDVGYSVDLATYGGYIVAGSTENEIGGTDVYLIKTDSEGNIY